MAMQSFVAKATSHTSHYFSYAGDVTLDQVADEVSVLLFEAAARPHRDVDNAFFISIDALIVPPAQMMNHSNRAWFAGNALMYLLSQTHGEHTDIVNIDVTMRSVTRLLGRVTCRSRQPATR